MFFWLLITDSILLIFISYISTSHLIFSILFALVSVVSLFSLRGYDRENLECFSEQFTRCGVSSAFSALFIYFAYKLFNSTISPKLILQVLPMAIFSIAVLNAAIFKILARYKKPIVYLVVGHPEKVKHILDEITIESKGQYTFKEFINPSPVAVQQKIANYKNILIADYELFQRERQLLEPYLSVKKIEFLPELSERVLKRVSLDVVNKFQEYYEMEFQKVRESPAKRVLDIVGSIIGLIVFSPFILLSAILILIEDGKPVVFKQLRVGMKGDYFEFIKLRSLKNEGFNPINPNENIENRVLKIGKIIRSTRIDESLQFWLVLKGKMSLVGPRPEMVEYHRMYSSLIPYYNYRLMLKPGITGWAQINYSHTTTLEEYKRKTEYDLYYIKNRSIFLDLRIILQTLEIILWKRGAR